MTSFRFSRLASHLAVVVTLLPLSAFAASLPTMPYLPLEMAQQAANAAMTHCLGEGERVSVAVVERGGATKVLIKADGSGPHTVNSSTGKAFAAASLGRETLAFAEFLKDHREFDGLRDMDARMVILGGGLPIRIEGALIGGIGVGGAPSAAIDEACARAGVEAIGGESPSPSSR